jgi:hypothetical protein
MGRNVGWREQEETRAYQKIMKPEVVFACRGLGKKVPVRVVRIRVKDEEDFGQGF